MVAALQRRKARLKSAKRALALDCMIDKDPTIRPPMNGRKIDELLRAAGAQVTLPLSFQQGSGAASKVVKIQISQQPQPNSSHVR
jgi:hypothetical protein